LDKSYSNFFRRSIEKKDGANIRAIFPRFKSKRRFKSFTYPQSGFEILPNGHLKLSKIGTVRMFKHREIGGTLKTCTIKRDAVGDWYAIFTTELPDVEKKRLRTAIGVDVGLEKLATLSTGETIEPPKFLIKTEEKIRILQRKLSKKKKGSENRGKTRKRLAKAHRRVVRQRDDFMHKSAKKMAERADVIVFENLNIRGMVQNGRLAKSIMDASWDKLIQYTTQKVEETAGQVVLVDPRGTSQICSKCGATVKKSLSGRTHGCPNCGLLMDRDLNASLNILGRLQAGGLELLKTPMEFVPLPPQRWQV